VYGEAQTAERHKTWDMLKFIKSSSHLPWTCIGDFNELLNRDEHQGVQERSNAQMVGFREMDVHGLYDLGFEGRAWTFEKKVAGGSFCRIHLDCTLVSPDWGAHFSQARVTHLTTTSSDHDPILLRWKHGGGSNIKERSCSGMR
jgi:endonuclease/exonuclease/phosphatase family metal-dependent hydrolase